MKESWLILLVLFLCFLVPTVLAEENLTEEVELSEEALEIQNLLNIAEEDLIQLQEEGINTLRYNDSLILAKNFYEAIVTAEKKGEKTDYINVRTKIDDLKNIKQKAFLALDELKALELAINQTEGINFTPVLELYQQAENEFKTERFELSLERIEETYEKISEEKAFQTKVKTFYNATSRGLLSFLKKSWKVILITLLVLTSGYFLFHKKIEKTIIHVKIKNLERRRNSVSRLIAETQKRYFEEGELGDQNYHIRTKKYTELVRDINRQIPLLREKLVLKGEKIEEDSKKKSKITKKQVKIRVNKSKL